MMDSRGRSVGRYLLRLVGGLAVICGLLMAFSSLAGGDLFGIVLSVILVGGGVFMLKRSHRAEDAASARREARQGAS
ncbi:hypothetical protein GA0070213_108145 [Micromonospora humi]|uniref:Uncharacterized protein n=1 Tax=Micromonospora humi TaxID=745366 RepID=A0A1C5J2I0_9ACTN|nr:hypothetical protein GA0070213_108145 [Micromonospora humi]